MATPFASKTFMDWLVTHPKITKYIEFDFPNTEGDKKPRIQNLEKAIKSIESFLEENESLYPQLPIFTPLSQTLSKTQKYYSNLHFFAQFKIYRLRCKSHIESINIAKELLSLLKNELKFESSTHVIRLNYTDLFRYLQCETLHAQMLLYKDFYFTKEISRQVFFDEKTDNQRLFMRRIINNMSMTDIETFGAISEYPLQEQFERIIFSPHFIAYNEVREIVLPEAMIEPSLFTLSVVRTMNDIIGLCEIEEPKEVTVFSIAYFRAIFNIAYRINPDFFTNKSLKHDTKIVCNDINPQILVTKTELLPSGKTVTEVIEKSECLQKASNCLSKLPFINSPLDSLSVIHEGLSFARDHIAELDSEDSDELNSFDSLFGVFLVAVLGSDINNLEEVFWFINSFSPYSGLSGSLEYARATSNAAAIHLDKIAKDIISKNKAHDTD